MFKLLKLVKLLRVVRVAKFLEAFETRVVVDYSLLQVIQHMVTVVVATHWVSCALLLFLHVEVRFPLDVASLFALLLSTMAMRSITVVQEIFGDTSSWTGFLDLKTEAETYIAALYFAAYTLTTIGYGDMIPETPAQRLFVTVLMLSGAFLYG